MAGSMVLQVVVSPFLGVLFNNLGSLIHKEVGKIWGVDDAMKKLARTLSTISDVLEDAEEKQNTDKAVANWLLKLRALAYDADDILDDWATEAARIQMVLGSFDASYYVIERKWASASDGTKIPISIVYRKNLVRLDGSNPLLLYGYGSYEACRDPSFKASRLSLLDRGFIFAIAHIRGGGEMGRQWYESGKLLKKRNTFSDFIDCAEFLIKNKYCSKKRSCASVEGVQEGFLLVSL